MPDLDRCYETALKLAKEAGDLIRRRIQDGKTVDTKDNDLDLVTETDQEVEKFLIGNLSKEFPCHKFIGEETAATGKKQDLTDDPTWVIDPVDGTMNFVHTFPHCCVLIALLVGKQPKIGIAYNPVLEQLFTAREGKGAFLNGKPIKVSGQTDLGKSIVMLESGTSRDVQKQEVYQENNKIFVPLIHGVRALGSAGLDMCMVAQGAADAYFEFGVHAWDYAAPTLIIREAGGVVKDPSGGPLDFMSRRVLAASSTELADEIIQRIATFNPKPRDDE